MRPNPATRWRQFIGKVKAYTEESVSEVEFLLDKYQNDLVVRKDHTSTESILKVVVRELNKLDGTDERGKQYGRFPGLIDSIEREDLISFIMDCALDAGMSFDDSQHLIDESREW